MSSKFKVGDVVKLNSGSPQLVVTKVDCGYTSDILVKWIGEDNMIQELMLPDVCFTRVVKGGK